jgi:hypothetical protein
MIERVARKLMAVAIGAGADSRGLEWTEFEHDARDLLSAIREPTDSMIIAGAKAMTDANNAIACDEGEWLAGEFALDARRGFPAMIDAALAEND